MIRLLPIVLMLCACGQATAPPAPDIRSSLSPDDVRSGYTFLQPETQALQDDDFANPSFLWIDRGKALFAEAIEDSQACSSCHGADGADLEGVAAHYPAIDEESGELVNMEGRINFCRMRYQDREPLDYESDELLALTAYVASLSREMAMSVDISGAAESWYRKGEDYFFTRRGQFNLACNQCHDENWGRKLLGWPQVTTLPSHEECHRNEEGRHRYIYISARAVIDRQEGQIITEDQMYEQDMQERYMYFPGVMVYERDRNEEISEKEMEMQMTMQLCYHDRWQRYFIVQNRVYDATYNEFISLEQFKQRQDEHNSETESELPPTGQQGEGQAAVALGGQEGSNDGSEQLEHISEAGEGHERQEKC